MQLEARLRGVFSDKANSWACQFEIRLHAAWRRPAVCAAPQRLSVSSRSAPFSLLFEREAKTPSAWAQFLS